MALDRELDVACGGGSETSENRAERKDDEQPGDRETEEDTERGDRSDTGETGTERVTEGDSRGDQRREEAAVGSPANPNAPQTGQANPSASSPASQLREDRESEGGGEEDRDEEEEWEDVEEGESDDQLSFEDPNEEKSDEKATEEVEPRIGCPHYRRKCKVVSPCCGEVFWCRHCHNEVKADGERDYRKAHELDRTAVTEIVCAVCETRQPVSNQCVQCKATFATYFCDICKFWDDDGLKKEVYHCDECGLCRTGGRSNYFHCKVCGSCYSTAIRDSHKCVGCKSLGDYGRFWERLDEEVARTPLPDELRRKATAICNDCGARSEVDYHIVGLKCGSCGGYNTREMNA
ncbi:hypothetical protein NCLIV_030960 [Neospora caninum Liverpool]|uniref:CHY zinc finger domain-containing protein n=1 Tax=Neospora caninum (strain Liverpool) TaxID=572307 RepID=F0VHU8_NEOCL|nr:hypothetical protein NCLIV_030960 [Neospora caninum Liverpool]CBZ53309.1 hypothetical protein NCLIV_030960 [Neospora caninum Liverpool]|eukprot:XP_003883341.1 hypothetical protein NCLIV_030960 [Neospora caninum Liverpool]